MQYIFHTVSVKKRGCMKAIKASKKAPKKVKRVTSIKNVIEENHVVLFHDDMQIDAENMYALFDLKEDPDCSLQVDLIKLSGSHVDCASRFYVISVADSFSEIWRGAANNIHGKPIAFGRGLWNVSVFLNDDDVRRIDTCVGVQSVSVLAVDAVIVIPHTLLIKRWI